MAERIVLHCKGLYLKTESETYSEIKRLEFLPQEEEVKLETEIVNPLIVKDYIPKSFPNEAVKIFEEKLPEDLFAFNDCIIKLEQEKPEIFVYYDKQYIILNKILYQVITKEAR